MSLINSFLGGSSGGGGAIVRIGTGADRRSATAYVTLQYTKTTD